MSLQLPPDIVEMVQRKVSAGFYGSPDEVISEAFRLLHERDRKREQKIEALRRELAPALEEAERGELTPLDMEEIIADAERRWQQSKEQ